MSATVTLSEHELARARLLHAERIVELRACDNVVAVSVLEVLGPLCRVSVDGYELLLDPLNVLGRLGVRRDIS